MKKLNVSAFWGNLKITVREAMASSSKGIKSLSRRCNYGYMDAKKRRGIVGFVERSLGEVLSSHHCETLSSPLEGERIASRGRNAAALASPFRPVLDLFSLKTAVRSASPVLTSSFATRVTPVHKSALRTIRKPAMTEQFPSLGEREDISCAKRTEKNFSPLTFHFSRECKRAAFTLAETLITLGIIGIVAALTLPSLIEKYQEKVTITKLKATYSILNEAVKRAIIEEGTVDNWCNLGRENSDLVGCSYHMLNDILYNYITAIKTDCHPPYRSENSCFAQYYTNRFNDKQWTQNHNLDRPAFVLKNGTVIGFFASNSDGSLEDRWCRLTTNDMLDGTVPVGNHMKYWWRAMGSCAGIMVDINGPKGPNQDGKDLFGFSLYRDGIVPLGRLNDHTSVTFENSCNGQKFGGWGTCTAWVIFNENMDYLHCNDLSWNGKHSCK